MAVKSEETRTGGSFWHLLPWCCGQHSTIAANKTVLEKDSTDGITNSLPSSTKFYRGSESKDSCGGTPHLDVPMAAHGARDSGLKHSECHEGQTAQVVFARLDTYAGPESGCSSGDAHGISPRSGIQVDKKSNAPLKLVRFDPDQGFLLACARGDAEQVRQCVARGASPKEATDSNGLRPVDFACSSGSIEVVSFLLSFGIQKGIFCTKSKVTKKSPLQVAAECGHLELVEHLISDVKVVDADVDAQLKDPNFWEHALPAISADTDELVPKQLWPDTGAPDGADEAPGEQWGVQQSSERRIKMREFLLSFFAASESSMSEEAWSTGPALSSTTFLTIGSTMSEPIVGTSSSRGSTVFAKLKQNKLAGEVGAPRTTLNQSISNSLVEVVDRVEGPKNENGGKEKKRRASDPDVDAKDRSTSPKSTNRRASDPAVDATDRSTSPKGSSPKSSSKDNSKRASDPDVLKDSATSSRKASKESSSHKASKDSSRKESKETPQESKERRGVRLISLSAMAEPQDSEPTDIALRDGASDKERAFSFSRSGSLRSRSTSPRASQSRPRSSSPRASKERASLKRKEREEQEAAVKERLYLQKLQEEQKERLALLVHKKKSQELFDMKQRKREDLEGVGG